jgi:hypothetical protein
MTKQTQQNLMLAARTAWLDCSKSCVDLGSVVGRLHDAVLRRHQIDVTLLTEALEQKKLEEAHAEAMRDSLE